MPFLATPIDSTIDIARFFMTFITAEKCEMIKIGVKKACDLSSRLWGVH
jgi:hypothetical protein